jgi:acyl-CoA thioester hydrolase
MARLDKARLDAAIFPVLTVIQTRFDDLDILGHVNNAATVVILQEARVDFNRQAGLIRNGEGLQMMAAGLVVEFAGELHHPAPVEVHTGVARIGRSSFTLAQVVRQEGRAATYAEATLVFTDSTGPAPIPDSVRGSLDAMSLSQVRQDRAEITE